MKRMLLLQRLLALLACGTVLPAVAAPKTGPVEILCGVGMIKPMEDLAEAYLKERGLKSRISYGGSGELLGKLAAGRPYEVLVPGDAQYLEEAARRGWVVASTRVDLVYHVPVIAVPAGNPPRIKDLGGLAEPGVKVALGDPKACAVGRAAETIFQRAGLTGKVKPYVQTAGASQLLLYLLMKKVDAAVIWEDLAAWPKAKEKLEVIAIPEDKNVISTVAAARVTSSLRPERAQAFLDFLATPRAVEIWRNRGFKPCER